MKTLELAPTPGERQLTVAGQIDAEVARTDWDAMVVIGTENVQFCTAAPLRSAHLLDRPNLVLWSRVDGPTILTSDETVATVQRQTGYVDVVGYDEAGAVFPGGIVDALAAAIVARGLDGGLLAVESDRMPLTFFERLRQLLPRASFTSCDQLLRGLRMVKGVEAITTMSEGARLVEQCYVECFEGVRVGHTERDGAGRLEAIMRTKGFSGIDVLFSTGEGATRIGGPTGRALAPGDLVRTDVKARFDSYYYIDAGRMAVVGPPSPVQLDAYRRQLELGDRVMQHVQVGRTCGDVYRFCAEVADELGVRLFKYGHIGIGHGIGVGGTERPVLHANDDTVIEEGMILNVEPDTYGPLGEVLHVEDMVLATAGGPEVISRHLDWTELPVIR
jgi:Xaa-Pro aminopeptidase